MPGHEQSSATDRSDHRSTAKNSSLRTTRSWSGAPRDPTGTASCYSPSTLRGVWAKKHVATGKKSISLEELRKLLGLESVKDAAGNIIQKARIPLWANFRQRALDVAIREINERTDLNISLESLGRSKHRPVTSLTFSIEAQEIPKVD